MTPTLTEIAARINAHLKRTKGRWASASLSQGGGCVWVTYPGDPAFDFRPELALAYLNWLDAGNSGTHWDMLREEARNA